MRTKEDAMGNGQLKPAFNLQHGVDSEYITWLTIGSQPTDATTLIPFFIETKCIAFKNSNQKTNLIFLGEVYPKTEKILKI
ncbi:MAG: hypothetical protein II073_07030 [Lachnospiraceae bacterium]|nr:hypothetical protein [Lachnospiraceae bacterium]